MSDVRDLYRLVTALEESYDENAVQLHDSFDLELNDAFVIETSIVGFTEDGVVLEADEKAIEFLELHDMLQEGQIDEGAKHWIAGIALVAALMGVSEYQAKQVYANSPQLQTLVQFHAMAKEQGDREKTKEIERRIANHKARLKLGKGDVRDADGNPIEPVYEAEYQGRKVTLNKPMQGDVKKFKVYVKDPKTGNVKKVNFGEKGMTIKKNNPEARKSFRARHKCDQKKDKTTAGYWSCRKW